MQVLCTYDLFSFCIGVVIHPRFVIFAKCQTSFFYCIFRVLKNTMQNPNASYFLFTKILDYICMRLNVTMISKGLKTFTRKNSSGYSCLLLASHKRIFIHQIKMGGVAQSPNHAFGLPRG